MELPSNYLEEMKELLGDQYEAYLASFEQKTRQGLRVNTREDCTGNLQAEGRYFS